MGKGMKGVVGVHAEFLGGDEHGPGGAQADVAAALPHNAGSHRRRGIVSRAGHHLRAGRDAEAGRHFRLDRPHHLVALIEPGHLLQRDAADGEHLLAPALVFHIQQQHAGGIGVVTAMHARKNIVDIVLGQHNLLDSGKVLRLVFPHPQELRRGKPCEGDVGRQAGQGLLAHGPVQVVHLCGGAAVVPQDCGPDH